MKKGTKIVLWLMGIGAVGVGVYFLWKSVKKKRDEEEAKKLADEEAAKKLAETTSNSSKPTTNQSPSNNSPLFPDDVKKFQDWMDKTHPNWVGATNFMLNNGQSLNRGKGYGNFGSSTKKAYEWFGKQWKESITNPSALSVVNNWGSGSLFK